MKKLLYTNNGKYAISFILGIGLASLFRKVCNDRNCLIFKGPPLEDVKKNVYNYNDKCYTFKEKMVKCNNDNNDKISF